MQFFIGIVPPEDVKEKIDAFRKSFSSNGVVAITEPHITIKSPTGLTEDKAWLPEVESYIKKFQAFQITLETVDCYSEDVIFLKPVFSQELLKLNQGLASYFKNEPYDPHLTLGGAKWGLSAGQSAIMKEEAKKLLGLSSFMVTFVRIYQEAPTGRYEKLMDISFGQ